MKIALTGHTQGIGKEIAKQVEVTGFSLSNGFNILDTNSRREILDYDFDILINNACDEMGQTWLLIDFFREFQDTGKTIINVGSRIAEIDLPDNYQHLLEYQVYKKSLKTTHYDLAAFNKPVNLQYVWFAYVGTEKILRKYPDLTDYIEVEEAAKLILDKLPD